MATPKQEEIKVRVTELMKARVVALAESRGESEAVVVREALNAYLEMKDADTSPEERALARERARTTAKPVSYLADKQRKAAKKGDTNIYKKVFTP